MNSAPWAGRRHAYAGWIPNVHSHLSFSLIGMGRGPDVAPLTPAYSGRLGRFVCVMQKRETDDFLAPAWWTRRFRPGATQHFLMIGRTEQVQTPIGFRDEPLQVRRPGMRSGDGPRMPFLRKIEARLITSVTRSRRRLPRRSVQTAVDAQGMLVGQIYVIPWQTDKNARLRQSQMIRNLRARFVSESQPTDGELDAMGADIGCQIREGSNRAVTLQFALFRTGEVRIWYENEDGGLLESEQRRNIARQSYFFIKDMVHHHVHHDSKSDQITPLTEIALNESDNGEEHWRRDTVWSLSRAVDALARRGKLQDLREAMGILAYADAFQETVLLYRRRVDEPSEFEPNSVTYRYDYRHIRESLKVQLDHVSARRTALSQMIIAGLAGSIAATSLIASTLSAHNGAEANKVSGCAIIPGIPDPALHFLANQYAVPTVLCGAFLWFASGLVLSEDRVGARRLQGRKYAQAVRGVFNSIAKKFGWDGAIVQSLIEGFYLSLIVLLILFFVWAAWGGVTAVKFINSHFFGSVQQSLASPCPPPTANLQRNTGLTPLAALRSSSIEITVSTAQARNVAVTVSH